MALEWAGGAGELVPRTVRGASLQIREVEMSETEGSLDQLVRISLVGDTALRSPRILNGYGARMWQLLVAISFFLSSG
jgi:hypothetical protein